MEKQHHTFPDEKPGLPVDFKPTLKEEEKWAIALIVLWLFILVWVEYFPHLFYF